MNPTHWHLLLNHAPVLGTIFGLGLLLLGFAQKNDAVKQAALGVFVVVALLTVPVYLTGEPAEAGVKGLPGVSEQLIEQHEQAATVAFVGVLALGVTALLGLILFRRAKSVPAWLSYAVLAAALIVSGLMAWTANVGGQIRHSEIRVRAAPLGGAGHSEKD